MTQVMAGQCESPVIWLCLGGTPATAPTITTSPITNSTTSISGAATANAHVQIYADGVILGYATANASGVWTANSLSFSNCQSITVKQAPSGSCQSAASAATSVINSSAAVAPIITSSYCIASVPTTVTVSGTSVEATGSTIRVYKNAVSVGTTNVDAYGNWSLNNVAITLFTDVITAKAEVSCKTTSVASNAMSLGSITTNIPTITTNPIPEGTASITGTGVNGDVIKLYVDGIQIGGTATVAGGVWTISGLSSTDVYAGGAITAKATSTGYCIGAASASALVTCVMPSTSLDITESTDSIYAGNTVGVTVHNSETQTLYQLTVGGVSTGTSKLGTGGDIVLTTGAINSDATLTVKTVKVVPTACSNNLAKTATVKVLENPMPINLLSFSAKCNFDKIDISWITANEQNNNYFTIEKSNNSWSFNELKKIDGAGNSNNIISYNVEDREPFNLTYYRLIQTDYDGKFSTFNPISISCNLHEDFAIDNLRLIYAALSFDIISNGIDAQTYRICLYDNNGRRVYYNVQYIENDSVNQFVVDLKNVRAGVYILYVENSDKAIVKKFILTK